MNFDGNNKTIYRTLCQQEHIPLFSQYWWMDAVCGGENWDVLLYQEKGNVLGAFPCHFKQKFGFRYILQPFGTQTNGIWFNYPKQKSFSEYDRLSFEKKVCFNLINQLESLKLSFFRQNFHFSFTNWLPFYWKGFKQTTRYTYQINIINVDNAFLNFHSTKKGHIRKCLKNNAILKKEIDANAFYYYHKDCLIKKNQSIHYSKDFLLNLHKVVKEREQGIIFGMFDDNNCMHSAIFLIWDEMSGYNYMTAIDPQCKSSGASSLMFLEAIKYLSDKTKVFDFEGSMEENIENSFRQFGSIQKPYFQIEKSYSPFFKLLFDLISKIKSK